MRIQELYIRHFGMCSERCLKLEPGLNLICGPNESGKSTTAAFVGCMLYGMKKGRGRAAAKDAYGRFRPWEGQEPEGSLVFSCRGRNFRLNRVFPERAELFCMDDGEVLDVAAGDLMMLLGGVSEGLYQNTVYAGNGQLAVTGQFQETLENYLLNMESIWEEQADIPAAERYLKEKRRQAETGYRSLIREREAQAGERRQRLSCLEDAQRGIREKLAALDTEESIIGEQLTEQERQREQNRQKERRCREERKPGRRFPLSALVCFLLATVLMPGAGLLFGRGAILPGAGLLTVGGFFLLLAAVRIFHSRAEAGQKTAGNVSDGKSEEALEHRRLKLLLRREQLEEEAAERRLEAENCREELAELEQPGTEEQRKLMEIEACEDAAERIQEAAAALAGSWGSCLEQEASEILGAITGGRYSGLRLSEGGKITVTDQRRVLTPEQLSMGTREQIWMSVRLAAGMQLREEPLPFLFDDAFQSWDDRRLLILLEWLVNCGHQVLLFAGNDREERLLRRRGLACTKIVLDGEQEPVYG